MDYKKLFNIIDELYDEYCKVWEDVCNIESPTSDKEGVDRVGRYFLEMAKKKGWKTEIFPQPVSGDVITITINPEATEKMFSLSGHTDTVFPKGLFPSPAVRKDEKYIYGPGVMDCKGGIVAAFMAMDALEKAGFSTRPVSLYLQSDEENGSITSNRKTITHICEKAKNSVAFFNLEGYLADTAVLERKGIIRFRYEIKGKAIHSARCAEGANAVAEAAYKIIELEKMKNPESLTCNCGVIKGGTTPNTVAETCEFYADIRFSTPEDLAVARTKVEEIANAVYIPGCTTTLYEESYRPAMTKSKLNYQLLDKANEIYRLCGMPELTARKTPSGSDAAYITECGIPCLDNLGTEGMNIHSINEHARLESLKESAKRIASVIYMI